MTEHPRLVRNIGPPQGQPIALTANDSPSSPSPTPLMDITLPSCPLTPIKRSRVQDPYGWNEVHWPKKGKIVKSPQNPQPTLVHNSFQPIANTPTSEETPAKQPTPTTPLKPTRPPPIILDPSLYSTSKLATTLRKIGIKDFRVQNNNRTLKLFFDRQSDYDLASSSLKATHNTENPVYFHTFAPKGSKPNKKFLLIGFDEDHPLDSVRTALAHSDLIDVRRLTSTKDGVRTETPNVLVTFRPDYNYETHLKSIKVIDNILIRHKEFATNRVQPTCGNCQAIGHTKRYCWRPQRCVRCGGNHSGDNCSPDIPTKCSNCGGDHPASFRQCPSRIKILQKKVASKTAPNPTVPRRPPPPPPSVWGPPIPSGASAHTRATKLLFPERYPAPLSTATPQVPLLPNPLTQAPDSTPSWVTELTRTLTSIMNTLITTVQTLLTSLPQMLQK